MKTLINKNNPQIRITAPEEAVKERPSCWAIWPEGYKGCRSLLLDKDKWTLVKEEPEQLHIDKPRGYNLVSEDATANGFNQPKEPVDLEKEIKKHTDLFQADIEYPLRLTAIKFYELGIKEQTKK